MSRPAGAVSAGGLLLALIMGALAIDVSVLASFDESVYKASAVHYTTGLPGSLFDDPAARGTARLLPLLVSPIFAVFDGDVALRVARALNSVLWAATAIPLFLLAKTVVASPWRAAAGALLAVAVPWITISTVLFSEALSLFLFAWALLAMSRALERPGWRWDLAVLVLIALLVLTRVQFLALPIGWLAVVVWSERRAGVPWRASWRRYPVLLTGAALAVVGVLGLLVLGGARGGFDRFAGPYSELQDRTTLPGDVGLASLWEVGMLALGVGLIPAVLCFVWTAVALTGRAGEPARRYAMLTTVVVAVLFAVTMFVQGGWIDVKMEERYFLYLVPLFWIGAMAALELRPFPVRWLVLGGVALAAVLFVLPIPVGLNPEQAFLGPVSGVTRHVLDIVSGDVAEAIGKERAVTPKDLAGYLALLVTLLAALAWRRARWAALVPAVVVQLFLASFAYATLRGQVDNVGGVVGTASFAERGWVDRALPGGRRAALLDNQAGAGRVGAQRDTAFWNDELSEVVKLEGVDLGPIAYPIDELGEVRAAAGPDLLLGGASPAYAVGAAGSPFWQLAGREVAKSADGTLVLQRVDQPARAVFASTGLDPDGHVVRDVSLRVRAGQRLTLSFQPPIGEPSEAAVRVALREGRDRRVETGQTPTEVTVSACDAEGVVTGRIAAAQAVGIDPSRASAGILSRVVVGDCP